MRRLRGVQGGPHGPPFVVSGPRASVPTMSHCLPHAASRLAVGATLSLVLGMSCAPQDSGTSHDVDADKNGLEPVSLQVLDPPSDGTPTTARPWFSDGTADSGLDFVYFNGMSGRFYFPEILGGGLALLDMDNDGDLDIYFVQGAMFGPHPINEATFSPPQELGDRLWRNDSDRDSDGGTLRFTDVTEEAGLTSMAGAQGYGMGVASGDMDNDGWTDLYVTRWGANTLLRNRGDGTFEDITASSGAQDTRWSTAATFVDFDRDGWLDLFVGNYVDFRLANHQPCYGDNGALDYCGPLAFDPQPDRLLRNRGDGTFEDVSTASGLRSAYGSTLGVVSGDFNGDGRPDLYVANDEMPNHLWVQQGDGTFEDMALLAGCALNGEGQAEASMGIAAADMDGDGDEDLLLSHLDGQTNTLYLNDGQGFFRDATGASGLGIHSWSFTGFGTGFFDADLDGWLDLFVANGAVKTLEDLAHRGDPYPLHQQDQLFRNAGRGQFTDISPSLSALTDTSRVGRGAAFGDLDNDGDIDILVSNNSGPAQLLRNDLDAAAWLGLRLVGTDGQRDMLGANVLVQRSGGSTSMHRIRSGGSYASASDPRLVVGLAKDSAAPIVVVTWPDGQRERWTDLPLRRYTTLRQGTAESP